MLKKIFFFFGSAIVVGLAIFFIESHTSRPAPVKEPVAVQHTETGRSHFPTEAGEDIELDEGEVIDVPYVPPKEDQTQEEKQQMEEEAKIAQEKQMEARRELNKQNAEEQKKHHSSWLW